MEHARTSRASSSSNMLCSLQPALLPGLAARGYSSSEACSPLLHQAMWCCGIVVRAALCAHWHHSCQSHVLKVAAVTAASTPHSLTAHCLQAGKLTHATALR